MQDGLNQGIKKLQQEFNQNPIQVIAVGSLAAHAAAKLINAISAYRGRRTWDREVDRRIRYSQNK